MTSSTSSLRALIVDDERPARQELSYLLRDFANIESVGEADCVQTAARLIEDRRPDVVFLDVQMRGETGFDLLNQVKVPFQVVFVTGHDSHAMRAFEVNAVDYLLKPVLTERLATTIQRLLEGNTRRVKTDTPLSQDDIIFLRFGKQAHFVSLPQIAYISAEGDYSEVVTVSGDRSLVLCSLKQWEERLPAGLFVRMHRSTIVNLKRIVKVVPTANNAYQVVVEGQAKPLRMSRRYASKIKQQHSLMETNGVSSSGAMA